MTETSDILVELSSEKKKNKSPGIYQITADVIKACGKKISF